MNKMQYTIRGVSKKLDNMVREQAARYRKSVNSVLLESLTKGLGANDEPVFDDLNDLAGTWVEDEEFDAAIKMFESVDEELWK